MATVRLSCRGFRIGRVWVPPFQLSEGEAVCLHVPSYCSEEREQLIRLLSEGHDAPGVDFFGSVAWADRPTVGGFLWRLRNPAIVDWLTRSGGLSRAQALEVLERWKESPHAKVGVMQWDPRTLIALDAALRRGADIVVFDTSGNGDSTIQTAFGLAAAHLPSHAIVYISNEAEASGVRYRTCFPGARCVELTAQDRSAESVAALSSSPSARSR